ncbi:MLP-like protein 328 [Camellia sinensis]|uniref:MLP-like protein 328 n=1 Tax=Camellia sinensis TaxID=4442 RepID=UPI001035ADDF|nr:MLP-like protein 328 [Camellia sinensis]
MNLLETFKTMKLDMGQLLWLLYQSSDPADNDARKDKGTVTIVASHHIQNVDLHEGEWGDHGSVKAWTCVVGKMKRTKLVHLTALEGIDCLEFYKSYNLIFHIIPKGETKVVKITIEYEKQNKDVPDPQKYLNYLINLFKDVDSKLVQA